MQAIHPSRSNPPSSGGRDIESKTANADPLIFRTVDTDVASRTAPAVTHEHIQPRVHEIRQEKVFREIHKHHVYHRTLPVLETEILPTRHFVESSNGKGLVEVSEAQARKLIGRPLQEWMVVPRPSSTHQHNNGEQWPPQTLKDDPRPRGRLLKVHTEPILVDKRTYVTEDGILRTEYLWRHPPVFEDVHGRTTPVRIPAGLSNDWIQAVKQSRQKVAAVSQGTDQRTRAAERGDGLGRGNHAHKSASPSEVTPSRSMGKHVVPAQVKSVGKPQHESLAIRTIPRDGTTVQAGGDHPSLSRKSSLQDLKGVEERERPMTTHDASKEG